MIRTRMFMALLAFALCAPLAACVSHKHTIGTGANGDAGPEKAEIKLYLFSIIPLSDVETSGMIQGDSNYVIETKMDGLSIVIQLLTGGILGARNLYIRE